MKWVERRAEVAHYWLDKVQASLESARREYAQGRLDFSANRLYYAAFYAVSAVLAARGKSYGKHDAVRAAFHRDLVKTGATDIKFGKLYDRLFYSRQKVDYEVFAEIDPEVLMPLRGDSTKILQQIWLDRAPGERDGDAPGEYTPKAQGVNTCRCGEQPAGLQEKVQEIADLQILDSILEELFAAGTIEEA
ncbi:MAG: HEPN domain-containing protein [Moorella sp. (in: Bacteria)]|nr:HEPN domain-containing protein [Moorella sp. (in: firmicutes)]